MKEESARPAASQDARSRVLRAETLGLLVIALAIFAFYLVRYFHLLHRSTP